MSSRPAIQIPVDVQDAWSESFALVQGIEELLSIATGSDEGISPEGCKALNVAVDHLFKQMEIVDPFFKEV
ncbi:MAG: hypothetical protein JXR49_17605 [Acidobacteria bacterium]|nr:hypothetical protein [Acidobacteriota bacterium]